MSKTFRQTKNVKIGAQRKSALFVSDTKTVFRSESAKYYIFIQLSKEMWMFDDDGSVSLSLHFRLLYLIISASQLFFEKAVDLFLPELFSRWEKKGTNHIVSIVLFSRIIYDKEEVDIVDRPLMVYDPTHTEDRWTDVYKVGLTGQSNAPTDIHKSDCYASQVIVDLETSMDWSQALHSLRRECKSAPS